MSTTAPDSARRPLAGLRIVDLMFFVNLNPGKLESLGLDAATLSTRNPSLIYCAISGFGLTGPDWDLPGYDLVAQARSGLMSVTGADGGTPQRVSTALSDIVSGTVAALAVSAAAVVVEDPQVRARGTLLPLKGRAEGLTGVRSPFRLGSLSEPRNEPVPDLSGHTVEILREAGYPDRGIEHLLAQGAVEAAHDYREYT